MATPPPSRTVDVNGETQVQDYVAGKGWTAEPGVTPFEKSPALTPEQENAARSRGLLASEGVPYGGPAPMALPPKTVDSGGQSYEFDQKSGHFDVPVGNRKPLTSPYEAYAYGSPDERKAAQDFITFEKQQESRYRQPGEIEQRYSLYQRDPGAYKDMFGDRGAAQDTRDEAQATRMLEYFDKQRKAIQNDFTLDDDEKQKQLADIDELSKPYLDAAGPGNGASSNRTSAASQGGNGPRPNEVEVISPTGQRGYVPKANLAKALKRGYKQAGPPAAP
jgi:hypothetical protein